MTQLLTPSTAVRTVGPGLAGVEPRRRRRPDRLLDRHRVAGAVRVLPALPGR